jgi:dihydrofolate reductase
MGRIVVWMQQSLDGYVDASDGAFDWPVVHAELHQYFVDCNEKASSFLYGRRVFEMMAAHWPTADEGDVTAEAASYARLWRPKPKVVFSTTLSEAPWNATVVPEITTASVARLTSQTEGDLIVFGGATVVGELFGLDVVDEVDAFVHPVLLGGGVPLFPALGERRPMRLLESSVFEPGVVHLRYERA